MASVLQVASPDAIRRIQRVQTVTIAWMSVEAAVSLFAAWRASSPSLLAFGGDSAIELGACAGQGRDFPKRKILIAERDRRAVVTSKTEPGAGLVKIGEHR